MDGGYEMGVYAGITVVSSIACLVLLLLTAWMHTKRQKEIDTMSGMLERWEARLWDWEKRQDQWMAEQDEEE